MRIHVNLTSIVLVAMIIALLKMQDKLMALATIVQNITPGHTPDEQIWGLLAFGMIMVAVIGLIKVLTAFDRRRSDGES
jgi:hypothetical protein